MTVRKTKIEWTESTWNPVTGCTKISSGCKNCYAEKMAYRLQAMGQANYKNGFDVTCHPAVLDKPLGWKKPQVIFVNSMSDLFHEEVPFEFIQSIFNVMRKAHWHTFQILTKRHERLIELSNLIDWPSNVWMGVTVESGEYLERVDCLRKVNSAIRFLSIEPLIGRIGKINLSGIDWVIVGGESGPGSRVMLKDWIIEMKEQCIAEQVPFFFKQWGGVNKKRNGRILDGRTWNEVPNTELIAI